MNCQKDQTKAKAKVIEEANDYLDEVFMTLWDKVHELLATKDKELITLGWRLMSSIKNMERWHSSKKKSCT